MSRVRAYLSECLVSVMRKTQLEIPIPETFRFDVPLDVIDIPKIDLHAGHGQREANFDGAPHLQRLLARKFKESPLGFVRHAALALKLNLAAIGRRITGR